MDLSFTKMHGTGNDYIYINCFKEKFTVEDAIKYSPILSHRHYSIGADGIILIMPSDKADVQMRMFNYDGSESEMCGNGIRCVAKYAYDMGISKNNPMKIETLRGILEAELFLKDEEVDTVEISMSSPILEGLKIPTTIDKTPIINEPIIFNDKTYYFTAVSMGNPHAVIFVNDLHNMDISSIGSYMENNSIFPNRTNVEFVEIINRGEVKQRTWERGSGETLACGTGASAVCVAGFISGRTDNIILNHLLGGDLILRYENDNVFMKGEARYCFEGSITL
ncbi:diaminopimelate epimerase [Brachyspira hyodysenteriae]|uniref:diaminopimelate epimerase n=1 Tax=Brachyspira hyodysenteriae TaxID=159 RepID=UPI00063DAD74|nr:diaminopimelate epimerase [Brachyspira hyodysenteriae]KLI25538.1 diaminopimelate epimerase [Brachyspira hyodysenteriae]TVL77952.1 diaminopimelate epimerase [Brachyspira hyodysenteriae]TVL83709.1 diaminopimelate epimerase [Brachyspira hyodysenteriae]